MRKFNWLVLLTLWLVGCQSVKYVEVPVEKIKYVNKTDTLLRTDSILTRDSVWMLVKGDTIVKEKYKYVDRLKYVYKTTHDTIYQRVDSTIVKVEYVEKPMGFFKKMKMGISGFLGAIGLLVVIGVARKVFKR